MNRNEKNVACTTGCLTIFLVLFQIAFVGFLAFLAYVLVMHYAG